MEKILCPWMDGMQFLQERKTVAKGSNSFSTIPMDMGVSGRS
ncbi:MAG: hypothetical protein ABJI60_04680 [Kangiellaceae bacterium]